MREKILKAVQKFLNQPFKYTELLIFIDKQKDLLLQPTISAGIEEKEYNAIWDALLDIEKFFNYAAPGLTIGAEISVLKIYNHNYQQRTKS